MLCRKLHCWRIFEKIRITTAAKRKHARIYVYKVMIGFYSMLMRTKIQLIILPYTQFGDKQLVFLFTLLSSYHQLPEFKLSIAAVPLIYMYTFVQCNFRRTMYLYILYIYLVLRRLLLARSVALWK
jgi:hypothetical protein